MAANWTASAECARLVCELHLATLTCMREDVMLTTMAAVAASVCERQSTSEPRYKPSAWVVRVSTANMVLRHLAAVEIAQRLAGNVKRAQRIAQRIGILHAAFEVNLGCTKGDLCLPSLPVAASSDDVVSEGAAAAADADAATASASERTEGTSELKALQAYCHAWRRYYRK